MCPNSASSDTATEGDIESSDGDQSASWGRRGVLQSLGLAALTGTATGTGAPTGESKSRKTSSFDGRGVLPVGRFGYDTIEEAWQEASDGDVIRVLGSYDAQEANEPFPIVLDYTQKEVSLVGGNPSGSVIDAGNTDANVIEVIGVGSDDYLNQTDIRDLRITGGNIGLRIQGAPFATYYNLLFHKTGSHGAKIDTYEKLDGVRFGTFNTQFTNCEAWGCGGDGFRSVAGAESHETYYLGCRATANKGVGFRVRGSASKMIGGVSQLNHSYGVAARQGNSITIDSMYVEGNSRSRSYPIEILAGQTAATHVTNCYFHGINPRRVPGHDYNWVQRAVNFYEVDHGSVSNCTARRYGDGLVAPVQSNDIDVNAGSHATYKSDILAGDPKSLGSERTRSSGMILPTDLSTVEGAFKGDVGYHVGQDVEGPAYWRNGEWNVAETRTL